MGAEKKRKKRWLFRALMGVWSGVIACSCQSDLSLLRPSQHPAMPPDRFSVRVNRVVSGQTIEIQPLDSPNGQSAFNQTIRLLGIQAPALDQDPWGTDAQRYLEQLIQGHTISLSAVQAADDYDRQFAYVWLNNQLVNQILVAEGYVLEDERSPDLQYKTHLKNAQHRARLLGLGIWNADQPMRQTPAEFRRQSF